MVRKIASARLIVCGDPGTGKTSLIRMLCNRDVAERTSPTVGCHVDCGIFEGSTCKILVEYVEISGKCKDPSLLEGFLSLQPNGFIYTYCPNNKRSFRNIKSWYSVFNSADLQDDSEPRGERGISIRDEDSSYIRLDDFPVYPHYSYKNCRRESLVVAMLNDKSASHGQFLRAEGIDSDYSATSFRSLDETFIHSLDSFLSKLIYSEPQIYPVSSHAARTYPSGG